MPKAIYRATGCWIVATDAGPAFGTGRRGGYVPQVVAYRAHRDSTASAPYAEGACFVGKTGINKAEYMAVIQGLRLVEDRMYVGDWTRDPVHVVCDNIFVIKQAIGDWEAADLGWHLDLLNEAVGDLYRMTNSPVYFIHAANEENSGAHTLVKAFPTACDERNRREWTLERLRERWGDLAGKLEADLAAAMTAGHPQAFDGKTLKIWFPAKQGRARLRVSRNLDEIGRTVSNACGTKIRVAVA